MARPRYPLLGKDRSRHSLAPVLQDHLPGRFALQLGDLSVGSVRIWPHRCYPGTRSPGIVASCERCEIQRTVAFPRRSCPPKLAEHRHHPVQPCWPSKSACAVDTSTCGCSGQPIDCSALVVEAGGYRRRRSSYGWLVPRSRRCWSIVGCFGSPATMGGWLVPPQREKATL